MKVACALVMTLALTVLVACAPASAGPRTVEGPEVTAEPTPTATQARETGLTPPARPFDADCGTVLTNADASELLGTDAALGASTTWFFAPENLVELHAGFHCQWTPTDGARWMSIDLVVLPAGAVSYTPTTGCTAAIDFSDTAFRCAVEDVVNGTRISGFVVGETMEGASTASDGLLGLFSERANATIPAPVPIPAIGAWALPVDCVEIVAAGDFSAVPGLGASSTGENVGGTDVWFAPAERALWGSFGMPFCGIHGDAADVTFVASGGGRWLEGTIAAVGTPFAIEGYESAYVSPGQVGLTKVDVFDGPNWLHFQIIHTSNAKALADALFAALNTTAAS